MAGVHAIAGANAAKVRLGTYYASHTALSPANASASFSINSDGTVTGTNMASGQWLYRGANSEYEVRASLQSGDTPNGSALDTWLALTSNHTWSVVFILDEGGSSGAELLLEIRLVSTGAVLTTGTAGIEAEVTP